MIASNSALASCALDERQKFANVVSGAEKYTKTIILVPRNSVAYGHVVGETPVTAF